MAQAALAWGPAAHAVTGFHAANMNDGPIILGPTIFPPPFPVMPPETRLPEFPPANNAPDMLGAARFLGLQPADFAHDDINFGLLMVRIAQARQYFRVPSPSPVAIGYGWLSHQLEDVVAHEGMLAGFDATEQNVAEFVIDQELFWSPDLQERAVARSPVVVYDPYLVFDASIVYARSTPTTLNIRAAARVIMPEEVRQMAGFWAVELLVKNEIHRLIGDAPCWHLLRRIWWRQWMDVSIRSLWDTLPNLSPVPPPVAPTEPGGATQDNTESGVLALPSLPVDDPTAFSRRVAKQALVSGAVRVVRGRAGAAETASARVVDRARFNAIIGRALGGR
jgi:hypothetical protein